MMDLMDLMDILLVVLGTCIVLIVIGIARWIESMFMWKRRIEDKVVKLEQKIGILDGKDELFRKSYSLKHEYEQLGGSKTFYFNEGE